MFPLRVLATLSAALLVSAEIYVINPTSGFTCHGGQTCTVTWMDNGAAPLLSSIGVTRVGLYTGHLQLLQTIESVDVSKTHSLTFTPDPKVGPNSSAYYISFVSVENPSYRGYSPWFTLDGMTGSFSTTGATSTTGASSTTGTSSTAGTTSSLPTASSSTAPSSSGASTTGTGSLTTPSTTGSATSSGFSTVFSSSSSTASSVRSSTSTTPSNAAVANTVTAADFTWTLLASWLGFILF